MNFVRSFKARKKFLDALASGDSIRLAAQKAGGTTSHFKKWKNDDPNFSADWDDAIEDGTDYLEDVATQRACEKSDPLMIMMLKARRPDKYDRGSKLEVSGGISVEGSKAKLLNRLARLQAQAMVQQGLPAPSEQVLDLEAKDITPKAEVSDPSGRGAKRRAIADGAPG